LALVRDVVERTIVAPTPDDVLAVRREALERVVAAGASPESAIVTIEIDARRNLVRATASGATAAVARDGPRAVAGDDERVAAAARALHAAAGTLVRACDAGEFAIFTAPRGRETDACAVDARGVVRMAARRAVVRLATAGRIERALAATLDDATAYGDVGRALPDVSLVYGSRVADLGTLADEAHVLALAQEELRGLDREAPVAIVAAAKSA
jgi:hypothetical protein